MKNQKILLAAALLALGAASCQKEENVITRFTAGMEQSSAKTTLGDGGYFYWETTDVVKVYSNGANEGVDFNVTPREGNGTWAVLSNNGGITEGDSYTAIYPASIAASDSSVTLPAVQTSLDGSLAEFPMYAESGSTVFQFKNLCGALRIHLEADNCTNCTISRIRVTAGSAINGTYTVSTTTEGSPSLVNCTNGSNTTTLILGTDQPIDEDRDFYVYLPAGTYSNMQLTFYQPDGTCCTKSGSVIVERSVCTPVTISGDMVFERRYEALSGGFSINEDGGKVRFASGNLQYVNGEWRFAVRQYDCLGTYSASAWDLFGWSTAVTYYGTSTSTTSSAYNGIFKDWGTAINPGGGDNPWKTLSMDEWNYLLQRSGKLGIATITDVTFPGTSTSVKGMVLLPDSWASCPGDCEFTAGNGNGYTTNEYTAAQWAQMEAAGAVFLPAAGRRSGTHMDMTVGVGGYWSATQHSIISAYAVYFDAGHAGYQSSTRSHGQSVRLVQDY